MQLLLPGEVPASLQENQLRFIRWVAFFSLVWVVLDYVILQGLLHWYMSGLYADYIFYWFLFFMLDTALIAFHFPQQQLRPLFIKDLSLYSFPFTNINMVRVSDIYRAFRCLYALTLGIRLVSVVLIPLNYPAEDASRRPDKIVFGRFHVNLVVHAAEILDEKLFRFYFNGKPNTADLVVYKEQSSLFKQKILTIKNVPFFTLQEPYQPGAPGYTPTRDDFARFSARLPLSPDTTAFWYTNADVLLIARNDKESSYSLLFAHRYEDHPNNVDTIHVNLDFLKNKTLDYGR